MGFFDFLWKQKQPAEEAEQLMMIACSFCKSKFPMANMQYDRSGQSLACITCSTKSAPPKPKSIEDPKQKLAGRQYVPPGYDQKSLFICSDCGFKFNRHVSFHAIKRCSYCSSGNVRPYIATQAQDILNHVENPERMYKY